MDFAALQGKKSPWAGFAGLARVIGPLAQRLLGSPCGDLAGAAVGGLTAGILDVFQDFLTRQGGKRRAQTAFYACEYRFQARTILFLDGGSLGCILQYATIRLRT